MRTVTKRGVKIKLANSSDLLPLSSIYKASFATHNIFQKPKAEVLQYLHQTQQKNSQVGGGFLVAKREENGQGKVVGGILLKKESEEVMPLSKAKHQRWKLNHLAVEAGYRGQGIGRMLMKAAEQRIREQLKKGMKGTTAKIELHVSEKEKSLVGFYQRFGFQVEGKLTSHYRQGEVVYAMGKEVWGGKSRKEML